MVRIFKNLGAEFEVEIYKPPVNWTKLWGSRAIAYFSPLVLAKFEGFSLLSVFPTVVWLDYDIVIQNPLNELWTKGNFDLAYAGSGQPMSNGFTVPPIGLDPEREGMSAGVMVFRSTFVGNRTATLDLYGLFSKEYSSLYYPEQAIFDLYFLSHQKYLHWKLDDRFLSSPGSKSPKNLIVHGYGSTKFWNGLQNDSWSDHYDEWLALGGWGWNPLRAKLAKLIRALKYSIARLLMLF
jgi:lipopolysaccharide biosynthesis glycosyltransferase